MSTSDPQAALDTLRASILFTDDFPKRKRYTHAEWRTLSEDDRRAATFPNLSKRVRNLKELEQAIFELGRAKYAPALPVLADLWINCAVRPLRVAAGDALMRFAQPEAWQAVAGMIEESDFLYAEMAARAIFAEHTATAFEKLSPYFDKERMKQGGGLAIPKAIFAVFEPSQFAKGNVPHWDDPLPFEWLVRDPRWVELCVEHREHPFIGSDARNAVRLVAPEVLKPYLKAARNRARPAPATRAYGDLLTRYRAGEYEKVWEQLRGFSAIGGDLREEALSVAREAMLRVGDNADKLSKRLANAGWKVAPDPLRTPPTHEHAKLMAALEAKVGPLPPTLRAFWENVGGINFAWDHDAGDPPAFGLQLKMEEMDPLCIDAPVRIPEVLEQWELESKDFDPDLSDPLKLELAPDAKHKANIMGGGMYYVDLPFAGADPVFEGAESLPFLDYLRLCFKWAGFPLLAKHGKREDVRGFVKEMTAGFEPF